MKLTFLLALSCLADSVAGTFCGSPQPAGEADSCRVPLPPAEIVCRADVSHEAPGRRIRPLLAAGEVVGSNLGILAIDHYLIKADYAKVTMHTVRRNLELTHWWWDIDYAHTNLLEHPYHGASYFAMARDNGLNFWQSALYSVGGSMMWELVGENELPSVNDFAATSMGGMALGEVGFRLASQITSHPSRGAGRVVREVVAAAVSPGRALNRLLTGEMFARRPSAADSRPSAATLLTGVRRLHHNGLFGSSLTTPIVGINVEEGNPTDTTATGPFDFFRLRTVFTAGQGQPLFHEVGLVGRWWHANLAQTPRLEASLGIYQHFNYLATDSVSHREIPYVLGEAASVGPGLAWRFPRLLPGLALSQQLYVNAMPLEGMLNDYGDHPRNRRHYNMGCGFNVKLHSQLSLSGWLRLSVEGELHRLYSWMGYDQIPLVRDFSQGHRGQQTLLLLRPMADVRLGGGFGLHFSGLYLHRHAHYTVLPACTTHTWDCHAALTYAL